MAILAAPQCPHRPRSVYKPWFTVRVEDFEFGHIPGFNSRCHRLFRQIWLTGNSKWCLGSRLRGRQCQLTHMMVTNIVFGCCLQVNLSQFTSVRVNLDKQQNRIYHVDVFQVFMWQSTKPLKLFTQTDEVHFSHVLLTSMHEQPRLYTLRRRL